MRVIVLGGAAAGGNTGQGCSGYYVEVEQTRLVLDLGPGTLLELRKHTDFRTLDGVVLSHLHVDHILDVIALRFALAYNPVEPPGPVPLWLPPGAAVFFRQLAVAFAPPALAREEAEQFFAQVFSVAEYDPAQPLTIGQATLTFAQTVHYLPTLAMRVAGGGSGDLVYTADTGPAARLDTFAQGAATLIAEATYPRLDSPAEPWDERGHLTAEEAAELAAAAGADTLVLTHLWEELDFAAYRQHAAAVYPGRIEIAYPGLTLDW